MEIQISCSMFVLKKPLPRQHIDVCGLKGKVGGFLIGK